MNDPLDPTLTLLQLLDAYEKADAVAAEAKNNVLIRLPKEAAERSRVLSAFQQEIGYRHMGAELLIIRADMEARRLAMVAKIRTKE